MSESINNVPTLGCPCNGACDPSPAATGQQATVQPAIMPAQSQTGTVIQSNNNGQGSYTIQAPEQTFVSTTVSGQESAPVAATSGQNAIDSSIKPMTGMKSIFSMMSDRGLFERSMPKIKTKMGTQKFPFAIAPRFNSLFW
jgi:hypothetical protein